jgi:hypothetical protein
MNEYATDFVKMNSYFIIELLLLFVVSDDGGFRSFGRTPMKEKGVIRLSSSFTLSETGKLLMKVSSC